MFGIDSSVDMLKDIEEVLKTRFCVQALKTNNY